MGEEETYYIDANVFIYAAINDGPLGEKCRAILKAAQNGQIVGRTSCLTFDEVLWYIRKAQPEAMQTVGNNLLSLNIRFLTVDKMVLYQSLVAILESHLKPRDAIHVATMKLQNIKNIISEDKDFDRIIDIKRIDIEDVVIE